MKIEKDNDEQKVDTKVNEKMNEDIKINENQIKEINKNKNNEELKVSEKGKTNTKKPNNIILDEKYEEKKIFAGDELIKMLKNPFKFQ